MWSIVGQTRAVSLLKTSLERGLVAHAYLLVGPPQVGKMKLALTLAQALNCQAAEPPCGQCLPCQKIASARHADVQIIGLADNGSSTEAKAKSEIGIDQIRQMQHSAILPPFEGKYKVFIIDGAEKLSAEAANCLLKTLEEPESRVVFILLTTNERLLPTTVISRCQRLELPPTPVSEVESTLINGWSIEPEKAKLLARLSRGRLGWALSAALDNSRLQQYTEKRRRLIDIIGADYEESFAYAAELATQFSQNRESVQVILDLWLDWWRDLLLTKVKCNEAITNVDLEHALASHARGYQLAQIKAFISCLKTAGEQLEQNANPQLVLETLMLSVPKKRSSPVKHG